MKLSRRDFVKGVGAGAALAGLSSLAVGEAQAAPARPGGREVLPIPDIQQPYPSALYGKDVQPTPAKPLRPPEGAPNVVIILIDDMGFGASSAFGGPINMPTLERVANEGLKYTRFHTTALCSPTRQALLTGRNHHSVGMGSITETATTAPGYNSIRPNTAATIPETLRLNGYSTAAYGKMHQTPVWEVSASGPFDRWPTGDGFEDFYGFVGAETNQWAPTLYSGHQAGRAAERPGLSPDPGPGEPRHRMGAGAARADARQALLRLPLLRRHACTASRTDGVERQVQGQVRPGLGRSCARRR